MGILDNLKNMEFDKPEMYILVKESKNGIETYINPDIVNFNLAYKNQLKAFLEGVLVTLKTTKNKKR